MATGMGSGPLTFTEIAMWQLAVGLSLTPWEARVLKQLSIEYLNESYKSEKPYYPAPYTDYYADEYRFDILPNHIRNMLRTDT